MCGIAGVIEYKGIEPIRLERMSKSIRHRGPDDEGFMLAGFKGETDFYSGEDTVKQVNLKNINEANIGDKKQIGFVHRRLSIIDLSAMGHQPMSIGNYHLIYNGEVYNYIEIRDELIALGHTFESHSDTEVILKAYIEWGRQSVVRFVGMWAFAILDTNNNSIFFSRDRFAIKPLYFYQDSEKLLFSSEIKTMLAYDSKISSLNEKNLLEFIYLNGLQNPYETLYNNISELPAGANAVFNYRTKQLSIRPYYNLEREVLKKNGIQYSEADLAKKYKDQFQESVKLHLRSDVPIGSCLSGGLDSSAITAFAALQMGDIPFYTYTAAYEDKLVDESDFAKMVSDNHQNIEACYTYPNEEDFWEDIENMIWHQDLPVGSTSIFAQWEVMKLAKSKGAKVLLDGQGADEVLGGYSSYTGVFLLELFQKFSFVKFLREYKAIQSNRSVNPKKEILRNVFHMLPFAVQNTIRGNQKSGKTYLKEDFLNTYIPQINHEKKRVSYLHNSFHSIKVGMHELLRYEDRNSMAFSIESRVPFLDHRLVELTLNIPLEYKIKNGWTKYMLRKAIEGTVPHEVVWRKDKKGFITPQEAWLKKSKKQLLELIESTKIVWDYFKKEELIQQINNPSLVKNYSEFWRLITALIWSKKFIER
jgi:asparagine synthase (glutamine-hydrolysing)